MIEYVVGSMLVCDFDHSQWVSLSQRYNERCGLLQTLCKQQNTFSRQKYSMEINEASDLAAQ